MAMVPITCVTGRESADWFVRLLERRPTYLGLRAVVSREGSGYGVYAESENDATAEEIVPVVMGVLFGELALRER